MVAVRRVDVHASCRQVAPIGTHIVMPHGACPCAKNLVKLTVFTQHSGWASFGRQSPK
jgi:hypothetical protein